MTNGLKRSSMGNFCFLISGGVEADEHGSAGGRQLLEMEPGEASAQSTLDGERGAIRRSTGKSIGKCAAWDISTLSMKTSLKSGRIGSRMGPIGSAKMRGGLGAEGWR